MWQNFCDMKTLGGGWTLIAKVQGQSPVMNKANTAQWRDGTALGSVTSLADENALGSDAYAKVPFRDVMIRSLTDPSKHVAWRHPRTYDSMKSVANGCAPVSDGTPLDTNTITNLDYTGSAANHNPCSGLKYGFFGYDYTYDEGPVAGCSTANTALPYTGHAGGVISISKFSTSHLGSSANCISDFAVGGGYHNMGSAGSSDAIIAHRWNHGFSLTGDFRTHAIFVR